MGNEGLQAVVEAMRKGRLDPASWVADLDASSMQQLEEGIDRALDGLPVPIGPSIGGAPVERRRILERLRAYIRAYRCGDRTDLVATARVAWLRGGSHIAYLRELVADGRLRQAAHLGRTLMSRSDCPDRDEIAVFLEELSHPPDGWDLEVATFASDPTPEGWAHLCRFAPSGDAGYVRRVQTIERLIEGGVDAERLFECVCEAEVSPEAVLLVDGGRISAEAVELRARQQPHPERRGQWLGLAARAAALQDERFTTVRLLREAFDCATIAPRFDASFIWTHADDELAGMLRSAGIPED